MSIAPDKMSSTPAKRSRRDFLATTGGMALGFTIVPPTFSAVPDSLRRATRKRGGRRCRRHGWRGHREHARMAPISSPYAMSMTSGPRDLFRRSRTHGRYKDFRVMLDKERKYRAVTRWHSGPYSCRGSDGGDPRRQARVLSKAADSYALRMSRADKAAGKAGVATQMGNQGHASEGPALDKRVDPGRRHRRGPRSPCLVGWRRPSLEAGHRTANRNPAGPVNAGLESLARADPRGPYHPAYAPVSWRGGEISAREPWATWAATLSITRYGHSAWVLPRQSRPVVRSTALFSKAISPTSRRIRLRRSSPTSFRRGALPPVRLTWYEGA